MQKEEPKPISALKLSLKASEDKNKEAAQTIENSLPKYSPEIEENELQKTIQEYHMLKMARKKEEEVKKREIFGPSSSEDDDLEASESISEEDRRVSTKEEQSRFRQSQLRKNQSKATKQPACQVYFSVKKSKEAWTKESIAFEEQSLLITQKPYFLKQLHKIKIMQGAAIADCNRIKLSCNDGSEVFVAANCQQYKDLPLNYYIFAFVIQQKLINMGKKLYKCQAPNLPGIPESLSKNSYNFGKLFKKSSVFGIWQEKLIVINKQGIYVYKKFNEKHSMFLAANQLKQIWTRFQVEDNLLVIKILHGSSKSQFGIPMTELLDKRCWLYSFYQLAFWK